MTSTNTPTASSNSDATTYTRALVFSLFLFSGVSGLIYEVVWSRMLTHVLGTTTYAVATVLAVFMGGLALGSWLFGRLADRPNGNGLRMYAWLELGIGGFALALPLFMLVADWLFQLVWPAVWESFPLLMVLRVVLAALVLIGPATLMGGTLPVLSRMLVRSRAQVGMTIGSLYAVNTLGAVIGCFATGFFLLELVGVQNSLFIAAMLNFIVGGIAFWWSRGQVSTPPAHSEPVQDEPSSPYAPWQIRLTLVLYAISGFSALSLEVLWTRSLLYFTSVDVWAFTAMLTAFLLGLGLGSLIIAPIVPRIRNPLLVLGVLQVLAGITAALSIVLFGSLYDAVHWFEGTISGEMGAFAKISIKLFASLFIMIAPTLCLGAAFPLVSAVYLGARKKVGQGIGVLYAMNTVGAIVGSLASGFVLIPLLGIENAILLCASLLTVLGVILIYSSPIKRRPGIRSGVVATAVLAAIIVVNVRFEGQPLVRKSWYFKRDQSQHKLIFVQEGVAASLVILENSVGTRLLNINGITTAIRNYMDMQVHRMLSHLPMLIHPDPETVLVVGFGMGSTPWGCTQHDVARVDVVELLRAEVQAAPFFEDINHNVLEHPKLRFIEGDGRNYLLGTRERYDVISFNAIHPRFSASLYTKDFYELCRERLTDDGVICAWLTQNGMTDDEFRSLVRTFVEVFPNSTLWFNNPEHYCLVGSMQPTRINLDDWQRRMSESGINADLKESNLDDPYVLLSRYMLGPDELATYIEGAPINTDDRPIIEFSRETKEQERLIVEKLVAAMRPPADIIDPGVIEGSEERLASYFRGTRWLIDGEMDFWYPLPGSEDTIALPYRNTLVEIKYRRALVECPDNQDIREQLRISDNFEQSILAARDNTPNHPAPWTELSRISMERGDLDQAQQYIDRANQLAQNHPKVLEQAGLLHLVAGHPARATPLLASALQATPQGAYNPRVRYALGIAQKRVGQSANADQLITEAINQDPLVEQWLESLELAIAAMRAN